MRMRQQRQLLIFRFVPYACGASLPFCNQLYRPDFVVVVGGGGGDVANADAVEAAM